MLPEHLIYFYHYTMQGKNEILFYFFLAFHYGKFSCQHI